MKRNKTSTRAMRLRSKESRGITLGNSLYAQKVKRGEQMFGPGCCGHRLTADRIAAAKRLAREEGRVTAELRVRNYGTDW